MEDPSAPSAQAQLDVAEEKARLQATFQRELQEHRDLLNAEFARRTEAMRAELTAGAGGPPPYPPPPPPPPPREVHLVVNEDLSNLPGRRVALPAVVTFKGQSTRDRGRIKVLLGFARFVRRIPGSIFTDPLEDLQHLLAQAR
jgi:hypothetical protein